ncbi:hypothetical protein C9J60_06365 [Streptomyces sp. A244]|uniref:hypothetical protein n=1 Tax=Streptomyces sp. A244 TaxID=2137016 RepID=UPI000D1AB804|nr:hypothetical protein [Streptomyces sp. A244]PTH88491.1 hypothetical protein C9J60_06365 [Streptomyces sp. A244]
MNTERPDNDDDAREAAGATADAPEVEEPGTADAQTPAEAGASAEAGESASAEVAAEADVSPDAADSDETSEVTENSEVTETSEASEAAGASQAPDEDAQAARGSENEAAPAAEEPGTPEAADVKEAVHTEARPDAAPVPVDDITRDEEDLVRHGGGRPRTPAIIASVAAAVLLIGGGGAWLAANASSGSGGGTSSGAPGGDDTPPPLALDGYSESTAGGGNGIAPGEPNPYGATYRVDGTLPDGPGKAPVYRSQGEVTKAEVARLAKALGVAGEPVAQGEAWKIGGQDGSGPSLQVNRQAPGAWTFSRYAPGTDNCKGTDTCTAPQPGGTPVGEDVAEKAATPVLKALGQDDAKVDASQVMGAQRVVNASPEVGGLPTHGWTTGITVGSDGEVVGGSGQLKTPVKGDTYPVVGAQKALELMEGQPKSDHRMGIGGCASPVPLKDRLEQPCEQPSSGAPQQDTVTVENAVFGLAAHVVDGRQALVPSWLFEVTAPGAKDPFTVTYPAVEPKFLASPEPSEPSDRPTADPGPREEKVDGYRAEGAELTVTFTGGVCSDYDVKASEKGGEVTVTVTSTPWPDKICIMIAKQFQETVRLDEPLGDRAVVNSDGKAVPLAKEGARLPAPPTQER